MIQFAIASLLMFALGCAEKEPSSPVKPGVVEYLSGAEQIKAYHKTKTKLEDINTQLKRRNQSVD